MKPTVGETGVGPLWRNATISLRGIISLLALFVIVLGSTGPSLADGQNGFEPNPGAKWAEALCSAGQDCLIGDFNGDGADDVATLDHRSGTVQVALSAGARNRFEEPRMWHAAFARGDKSFAIGNFNHDGFDDLVAFDRGSGETQVALSNGRAFVDDSTWRHADFCHRGEICEVGDFNGDGRDDLVAFVRDSQRGEGQGDVYVSLASAGGFATGRSRWHNFFCVGEERCDVGDFNGDGKDDLVAFAQDRGLVYVALANIAGTAFDPGDLRLRNFCERGSVCATGDFDDDGRDDLIAFARNARPAFSPTLPPFAYRDPRGDVYVALAAFPSDLTARFQFAPLPAVRHDYFCIDNEVCRVGDFNGDGRDDIATFVQSSNPARADDAYVALSNFGRPTNWELRLERLTIHHAEESGGDEPYLIVVGFRSRFGVVGSTSTFTNRYRNDEWAENIQTGHSASVPHSMGVVSFPDVTLPTAGLMLRANVGRGGRRNINPELLGAVILAMDSDGSSWALINDLVRKLRRKLQQQLEIVVEGLSLADLRDPVALQNRFEQAGEKIRDAMTPTTGEAIAAWRRSLTDPDDLIGVYIFGMVAMDREGVSYVSFPEQDDLKMGILGASATLTQPATLIFSHDNPRVDGRVRYDVTASVVNVPR